MFNDSLNKMETLFFELLQVAIGERKSLSRCPSTKEWCVLFDIAKSQAVVGIAFYGIQKLPKEQVSALPIQQKMQWLAMTAQIQKRNEVMNRCSVELQKRLIEDGIRNCVLKGQGIAALYGNELASLRQSGDIDLYVDCKRKEVLQYLDKKGIRYGNWDFLHVDAKFFDDVEVEVHYRPSLMRNIISNYRFQKFINSNKAAFLNGYVGVGSTENKLVVPASWINVFYLLHHTYRHFLTEGIGFRQVMDCYFAILKAHLSGSDMEKLRMAISRFRMKHFVQGLTWVIEYVFLANNTEILKDKKAFDADEKEGNFILGEIMQSGNFGHSDNRYAKGKGKTGKLVKVFKRSAHLLAHYPDEALAAPFYYGWHFCWKKSKMLMEHS